jgi:NADH-ubiquinone oxidoreductase chain 2
VVGLVQFRIKKLLAYSSISHIGFLLLALAGLNQESTQAFLFYLSQYTLININIFFIIVLIGYSLKNEETNYNLLDREHSPVQLISQLKGYFYINPVLALSLAISLFSLMGIPPLLGFFGKLLVLSSALQAGYVFLCLIAVLTSVVGGVYYLHIIKAMFFFGGSGKNGDVNKKNYFSLNQHSQILPSSSLTIPISVLSLINVLFILYPQLWLSSANILAIIF